MALTQGIEEGTNAGHGKTGHKKKFFPSHKSRDCRYPTELQERFHKQGYYQGMMKDYIDGGCSSCVPRAQLDEEDLRPRCQKVATCKKLTSVQLVREDSIGSRTPEQKNMVLDKSNTTGQDRKLLPEDNAEQEEKVPSWITTKLHTDLDMFTDFLQQLDGGQGYLSVNLGSLEHSYYSDLSERQRKKASEQQWCLFAARRVRTPGWLFAEDEDHGDVPFD